MLIKTSDLVKKSSGYLSWVIVHMIKTSDHVKIIWILLGNSPYVNKDK